MAASCMMANSCMMATPCRDGEDHVRDVAMDVAARKMECENDIYTFKRPDYTAEEWRWLYMTTGSDCYLDSLRLLGFCGVDVYHRERILKISTLSCNEEEEEFTKPPTR